MQVKAGSWLLLIGSVVFTTIVLGAYAMPTAPQLVGEAGTFKDAQQAVYVAVHGVVMWAMIVPVVFSLMCTFAWFIFYCELHMIDVRETEEKMLTSARELMSHVGTAPESYGQESHRARRRSARFLVKVKALADAVQARLDLTCSAWSFLSLHLLLFATCQIMVVCFNIEAHLIGIPADVGFVYSWWHYLQDVFHGVCGIIVLAIHFGCFARVTAAEDHIVDRVMAELETDADHTHATPELLGSFFALLSHSLSGVKIVSLPFNAETRVAFFWGLLCTFWASFTVILCTYSATTHHTANTQCTHVPTASIALLSHRG